MDIIIEPMRTQDWQAVKAIYTEGLATGQATFETAPPDWEAWNDGHLAACRMVARSQDALVGWAALSPVSKRACYAGVAEVSIYVAEAARGQGIGKALLQSLVEESERAGIWMLQSSLFAENIASQALHEAAGFRLVGRRERIARRDGAWHDTILMERRSRTVGA